jgi:hypothetical protein
MTGEEATDHDSQDQESQIPHGSPPSETRSNVQSLSLIGTLSRNRLEQRIAAHRRSP